MSSLVCWLSHISTLKIRPKSQRHPFANLRLYLALQVQPLDTTRLNLLQSSRNVMVRYRCGVKTLVPFCSHQNLAGIYGCSSPANMGSLDRFQFSYEMIKVCFARLQILGHLPETVHPAAAEGGGRGGSQVFQGWRHMERVQ